MIISSILRLLLILSLVCYLVDILPIGIFALVKYPEAVRECMKAWNWIIVNNVMILCVLAVGLVYKTLPDNIRKLMLLFFILMFTGIYTFGIVVQTADATCKDHMYETYDGLLQITTAGFIFYTLIICFVILNTVYEILTKKPEANNTVDMDMDIDTAEVLTNSGRESNNPHLSLQIPFLDSKFILLDNHITV